MNESTPHIDSPNDNKCFCSGCNPEAKEFIDLKLFNPDNHEYGFEVSSVVYGNEESVSEFVEVLFKGGRKDLYKNPNEFKIRKGDLVIVSLGDNTKDAGIVFSCGSCAMDRLKVQYKIDDVSDFISRVAEDKDKESFKKKTGDERNVITRSRELVEKHKLDMKVTDAEWQFDRQRLTIFFTAPQRVDFRELVKELARTFKTRIELRQISSREETKRLGEAIGPCGLRLCCTSFLHEFSHVTLDHARKQQLSNNVAKLSGYCGRLKCCLLYEFDTYEKVLQDFPPVDTVIKGKNINLRIVKVDVFRNFALTFDSINSTYEKMPLEKIKELTSCNKVFYPKPDMHHDIPENT